MKRKHKSFDVRALRTRVCEDGTRTIYASLNMNHKRYKKKNPIVKTMGNVLERATGIEPAHSAWEADVLPLNYARENQNSSENRAELMELVM